MPHTPLTPDKLAFPPDLYPNLAAAFFSDAAFVLGSVKRSPGYGFAVITSHTLKKPTPHREAVALLARTCKALNAAVRERLAADARLPLLLFWRQVLDSTTSFARRPPAQPGLRLTFKRAATMHKLWWPERVPSAALPSSLTHEPVWSNGACKVVVVWIHRHRNLMKLQCGPVEHSGPAVTFSVAAESDDEDTDTEADSDSDTDAHGKWTDDLPAGPLTPVAAADLEQAACAWLRTQRAALFPAFEKR